MRAYESVELVAVCRMVVDDDSLGSVRAMWAILNLGFVSPLDF